MIAILDYGMGNIHSVSKAIQMAGAKICITDKPEEIITADKVIFPGVAAFSDAIDELNKRGMVDGILDSIKKGKFFLGICLGMQLLFKESEESDGVQGLGVIKGNVRKFEFKDLKVPHMGWNQLKFKGCRLLKGISNEASVYFCHSYYVNPLDKEVIAATTDYGINFCSVLNQDNVFGVQFHPEKSQAVGLKILKNFVDM